MDRFAQMIVAAARQAEADSGLEVEPEAERIGASIATGIGGLKAFQDCYDVLLERGPDRVNPFSIPQIIPNMGAAWVSMELGTRGPLSSQCTACAASNMAIGEARRHDPARPRRRRCSPAAPRPGSRPSGSPASAPCARSRGATTTRAGEPAVRRRPRRVRDGRGGRRARARGARARAGARREDLRRADRLRALLGRARTSPSPTRAARTRRAR